MIKFMKCLIRKKNLIFLVLVFFSFTWSYPSYAAVPCEFSDVVLKSRPHPEGTPTEVNFGVTVFDLADIITVKQEFIIDFYVGFEW